MNEASGPAPGASGGRLELGFISRRALLKLALGGGGLALAGGAGWRLARGDVPPVEGLRVLSPSEYRTLLAIARVHLPRGGPFPRGAEDLDLARAFDRFLADEPAASVRDLGLALTLVELGPLLFDWRLTTFSRLPPEAQLEHWRRQWVQSGSLLRRKASVAFRKFLALVFYDQESVWPHIGYPGPGA